MTEGARRIGALPADLPDDYHDPDLADPDPADRPTVSQGLLADLEAQLTAAVPSEPILLQVVKRPGVAIRYRTDLEDEKVSKWRKMAEDPKAPGGFNTLRYCLLVVANQCDGIFSNGKEAFDEDHGRLYFGHKWIRSKYGADRAVDAARALIGNDSHVMIHANAVMDASGMADQAVTVDESEGPTMLS